MITTLLLCLGVFHGSCMMHDEFLCDPIDVNGVLALHFFVLFITLLFLVCQVHGGCFNCWLGPLELLQGEETSHPWFARVIGCLASWASG